MVRPCSVDGKLGSNLACGLAKMENSACPSPELNEGIIAWNCVMWLYRDRTGMIAIRAFRQIRPHMMPERETQLEVGRPRMRPNEWRLNLIQNDSWLERAIECRRAGDFRFPAASEEFC